MIWDSILGQANSTKLGVEVVAGSDVLRPCACVLHCVQVPAAAAEAGAVSRLGWPGAGAILQADPPHLQPVHHTVSSAVRNWWCPAVELSCSKVFQVTLCL